MDNYGGVFIDVAAVTVENGFLKFLKSFQLDPNTRDPYYETEIAAMDANESTTIFIDFSHVIRVSDDLGTAISDEYMRYEPYLKNACKRFVMEQKPQFIADDNPNKDINIVFFNIPLVNRLSDTVRGLAVMSDLGILSASHDGEKKNFEAIHYVGEYIGGGSTERGEMEGQESPTDELGGSKEHIPASIPVTHKQEEGAATKQQLDCTLHVSSQ